MVQKHFESEDEAQLWIIYNQFGRRNISDYVSAELGLQAKPIISGRLHLLVISHTAVLSCGMYLPPRFKYVGDPTMSQ